MPGKYAADWDLPVGGFLDDADVTVQAAVFKYDAGYNDGKSLVCDFTFSNDATGEISNQHYSVGGDWISPDGGLTIQSPSGKRAPSRASNYGRFCQACIEVADLFELISDRGPTTDGRIWDGLKLHLKAFEITTKFRGEERTFTNILPTAFNGVDGSVAVPQNLAPATNGTVPAPVTMAQTPEQIVAAARAAQAPANDPLRSRLIQLAQASADHTAFLSTATTMPEVFADEALLAELMDTGPAGFYLQVKGS